VLETNPHGRCLNAHSMAFGQLFTSGSLNLE
jgi:hypothetical protein